MFGGLPGTFLDLALFGAFQLVTSPILLAELDEKLVFKFNVLIEDSEKIQLKLKGATQLVEPAEQIAFIREDPDDDRVLECAVAAKANCIVSGDRHLLKLGSFRGIKILTVRQFIDELQTINLPTTQIIKS